MNSFVVMELLILMVFDLTLVLFGEEGGEIPNFADSRLVDPVVRPFPLSFSYYQARFLQNSHVVAHRRLGKPS